MEGSPATPGRYTAKRYFEMAEIGLIAPDDRVELLDGIVVAMSPQSPRHATGVYRAMRALVDALPASTVVRVQTSFLAGPDCVPEPDILVAPGFAEEYEETHPTRAHLVIEVADSSLVQDRLTKTAVYARAGVPQYWIVNLRDGVVEWFAAPDRWKQVYLESGQMTRDGVLRIHAFPDVDLPASKLLPPRK